MDFFRALPAIREELEDIDQRVRGRMATVTAVQPGGMVTVTLPGTGAVGPYPTTTPWVGVGATGILQPLRGGQFLFMATGADALPARAIVPFTWQHTGEVSTSSLATPAMAVNESILLSAGTWRIDVSFTGQLRKSVNTYGVAMHTVIDDFVAQPEPIFTGSEAYTESRAFAWHRSEIVALATPRAVPVALGVLASTAAGTAYLAYGAVQGQAIRTG